MDTAIGKLINYIINGGPGAISAILLCVILFLVYDRTRLNTSINSKDTALQKIVADMQQGNITIAQALDGLKNVLYEVKGRLD